MEWKHKQMSCSKICWKSSCFNFWDSHGIIFTDYLYKRKSVTWRVFSFINKSAQQKSETTTLQDNGPPRKSNIAMNKLRVLGFELVQHLSALVTLNLLAFY